jgi:hypothetical protein
MNNFTAALAAIYRLKNEGVVKDYAIGGAMALAFWSEPIPTFDLGLPMSEMRVADALKALQQGKRRLRTSRRNLTLAEKVDQVVELQRIVLPLIRRRRPLKPWERVWELRA